MRRRDSSPPLEVRTTNRLAAAAVTEEGAIIYQLLLPSLDVEFLW